MWSEVGPQPIQVSEISSYLVMLGIEESSTKLKYVRLVQRMDRVELDHIAKKQKGNKR